MTALTRSQAVVRLAIASLVVSAAGYKVMESHEGFTNSAVIPIPGDRPTIGYGNTYWEDGTPVKIGDKADRHRLDSLYRFTVDKHVGYLRKCVTAPISQTELDVLADFVYWFGPNACNTAVVKHLNAGRYSDSCAAYLQYRTAAKKDCSIPANKCRGVWLRAQERNKRCLEAQNGG